MTQCPACSSPVEQSARFCSTCGCELPALSSTPTMTSPQRGQAAGEPQRQVTPSSPRGRFIPGTVLAERYRMVERVGQGGMGEVYRADDLKLGELVALKFLPPTFEHDPDRLKRLFSEVSTARQVSHPNVCRVYDVVEDRGIHFLSMEFVDGEDLASLLRRIGHLPAEKAILIARETCMGLAAIHERGLIHRDLKPGNVMLDGRGHVRITDFGLAELQAVGGESEEIVGTPAYMAPEVIGGGAVTARSDLYSLGVLLYELFTGKRPFEAGSLEEMLRVRRERTPTTPSAHIRDLDPVIERVILRCLETDPERRPPSARAAAMALPGGDPIEAALAAGETPSPEVVVDAVTEARALSPAAAWACLAVLLIGLAAMVTLSPLTRMVPAAAFPEPPAVMAARARDLIRGLGMSAPAVDRAQGFAYDQDYVAHIAAHDRSRSRWHRLSGSQPPAMLYWYRQSPRELSTSGRTQVVTYSDPPLLEPGMIGLQLDGLGRLRRLDALPDRGSGIGSDAGVGATLGAAAPDRGSLFAAAGLDTAAYWPASPPWLPPRYADTRAAWERRHPGEGGIPARVEAAWYRGHPVFFATIEPWSREQAPIAASPAETTRVTALIRPAIIVLSFLVGAWLARRNLRAGRADRKRAFRMASILMGMRLLVWVLAGHHAPGGLAEQFAIALAWSLYDFAYVRIFYIAIEPYVRRLWPRVLVSWMRLLDGRHADSLVGRDLLIGGLLGIAMNLGAALQQQAPLLLGAPPGRPDNVGFVEPMLAGLLGIHYQVAQMLILVRSAIVLALGFVVILVVTRILLRRPWLSIPVTFLLFVPLAMPRGEFPAINLAFAALSLAVVLFVLMRFGLLAATAGLVVNAMLQSAALNWNLGHWSGSSTLFALLLVGGIGAYGFARALGGRPAMPDPLLR